MIVHSVTHRFLLEETAALPPQATLQTPFGHLTGHTTPDGFQIDRIHSTNPADYLNKDYSPGNYYKR